MAKKKTKVRKRLRIDGDKLAKLDTVYMVIESFQEEWRDNKQWGYVKGKFKSIEDAEKEINKDGRLKDSFKIMECKTIKRFKVKGSIEEVK